jgi:hypothetical protein
MWTPFIPISVSTTVALITYYKKKCRIFCNSEDAVAINIFLYNKISTIIEYLVEIFFTIAKYSAFLIELGKGKRSKILRQFIVFT